MSCNKNKQVMNKEDKNFLEQTLESIKNEYGFSDSISKMILDKAWEQGHAYGYKEVLLNIEELAEIVKTL